MPALRRMVPFVIAALVSAGLLVVAPSQAPRAHADDPPLVDWTSLLPGLTDEYDPNSDNACVAGRPQCIAALIKEMEKRFKPLGTSCHHNAVFALTYLRTTQTYEWSQAQPGFYADYRWVNHYAAVFAKYYLRAYDDYAAGQYGSVPQTWRIAFDGAKNRRLTGNGNLMLGMSSHITRDLPYVLAAIGIVAPDGTSRKADHDKVNTFLNMLVQPLLLELPARFDPDITNLQTPYGAGYTGLFQTIQAWREQAWRDAERLEAARTQAERDLVAQSIETASGTQASALAATYAYAPGATSAPRDAFCAVHNGDQAPMAYPFGMPAAYGS